MHRTDVLILGSGVAGCSAALTLAKEGLHVTLVSSGRDIHHSDSFTEYEGVAYAKGDAAEAFAKDLLNTGGEGCCPRSVEQLVTKGAACVDAFLIEELGIGFDHDPSGHLLFAEEYGHSEPRVLRCGDHTGQHIVATMLQKVVECSNIEVFDNYTAVDLITLAQHSTKGSDAFKKPACIGAYVLNNRTLQIHPILAKETILATGGLGQIFLHTTNSYNAKGDGVAMAHRAGARTMNLHHIQFHPTTFYSPNEAYWRIPDAWRRCGGELLSHAGAPFMERYHEKGSAAPYSVVARAAYTEMVDNDVGHLWLDVTRVDGQWLQEKYSEASKLCYDKGIDITQAFLPVVPAAHCCNGGVVVDIQGQTTLQRLRAVGEVACTGVFGEQRLPSVSLLEGIVWGTTCGEDIAKEIKKFAYYFPEVYPWPAVEKGGDATLISQDWASVKHTMWNYAGIIRDQHRLQRAQNLLQDLQCHIDTQFGETQLTPALVGLRNGITTSLLVASAEAFIS